jgi:hypothetical protein
MAASAVPGRAPGRRCTRVRWCTYQVGCGGHRQRDLQHRTEPVPRPAARRVEQGGPPARPNR